MLDFINREKELKLLDDLVVKKNGLLVVTGRRRVGKTRLLKNWIDSKKGGYTQAIEGSSLIQLEQIYQDLEPNFSIKIPPKNWHELLQLIENEKKPLIICIDEFPYLVNADPSLPSVIQRWLDHTKKKDLILILSGSSRKMMYDAFLDVNAPLYGRALRIIPVEPMGYYEFCRALKLESKNKDSFSKFSLVGGVPKYWELLTSKANLIQNATELYFDFAPYMQTEPKRILKDEKLDEINPITVLELIGRGAHRPSEVASRMETKQANLSRVFQHLIDAHLLVREIPFGISLRDSKHSLYKIKDPALRFWYNVFSPHQSNWERFSNKEKSELLIQHASSVFEDYCRDSLTGASRYWENGIEIDIVAPYKEDRLIVAEVKYSYLSDAEKNRTLHKLESKWESSKLAKKFNNPKFMIFDLKSLH